MHSTIYDSSMYDETLDGIDKVISLARRKPCAFYDDANQGELTMREVLSSDASDLDEYQPDLAARLDRAHEDLPSCPPRSQ